MAANSFKLMTRSGVIKRTDTGNSPNPGTLMGYG